MSPDDFRERLLALDWSQRGLAAKLNLHPTTVRRWAMGVTAIPDNVAVWLDNLARAHREFSLPRGWFPETGSGVPLTEKGPLYREIPRRA